MPPLFTRDSRVLPPVAEESTFCCSIYSALWTPPPLSDRDFLLRIRGYDVLEEAGAILLLFDSADESALTSQLPAAASSRVRMQFHFGAVALTILPAGATLGTLRVRLDPAMPGGIAPPSWAVTWALQLLIPYLFDAARRIAASVASSSVYAARIAANQPLYGLVSLRVQEHEASAGRCGVRVDEQTAAVVCVDIMAAGGAV